MAGTLATALDAASYNILGARTFATIPLPGFLSKLLGPFNASLQQNAVQQNEEVPRSGKESKKTGWRDRVAMMVASGEIRAPRAPVVLCHGG
jgi:hypothetical protein